MRDDELMHYGRGHLDGGHSGRYPWGSGDEPFQNCGDFLSRVKEMREANFTWTDKETGKTYTGDSAIAKSMKMSINDFRKSYSVAKNNDRTTNYNRAKALYDAGMGYSEIARKMNLPNESSARSLLKVDSKNNMDAARNTAEFLKKQVDEKGMIEIGDGIENELGITRTKLDDAIFICNNEGYKSISGRIQNVTDPSGLHQTTLTVLAPESAKSNAVYDYGKINFMTQEDYDTYRAENGIETITDFRSRDNGETYERSFKYPASLDSSRLKIRYADEVGPDGATGIQKDGTMQIRRGVADLSLGNDNYSQVRIMVDNSHYLKGMAVYGDDSDFPDGVDIIFNTNKSAGTPALGNDITGSVLKPLKTVKDENGNTVIDKSNPFGSSIKEEGGQYTYIDSKGKEQLGLINKCKEEGDVGEWSKKLPSQFLSKQTDSLAKRQLTLAIKEKQEELDEINDLTNNTFKKEMLMSFASDCDKSAETLAAATLPRQQYHVILPLATVKDTEIYAPNYENGEKVALVRFPHESTSQIPILTVNNKLAEGKKVIGNDSKDAVGISAATAERLSGADFDGDTVIVIPTDGDTGIHIKSTPVLKGLQGFDGKTQYKTTCKEDSDGTKHYYNKLGNEIKVMNNTQTQMGIISNLITDMTIAGATDDEMARAIRHSNVVIDAEKHKLDYQSSERENGIQELKTKYQVKVDADGNIKTGGASTILSRASGETNVLKREGSAKINQKGKDWYDESQPEGSLIYKTASGSKLNYLTVKDPETGKKVTGFLNEDGNVYYNKGGKTDATTGKRVYVAVTDEKVESNQRTQKSTQMADTNDAHTLVSKYNTKMENLYAEYANTLKSMANSARLQAATTPGSKQNSEAKKTYAEEYQSLTNKIDISEKNAPRERQAQILATVRIKAKKDASSTKLSKDKLKKLSDTELKEARKEVGASRQEINVTEKEWEAIQSGVLTDTQLKKVFRYADSAKIREMATPSSRKTVTAVMEARIKAMSNAGKTNAEIAKALGLSASTVSKYVK